jgi:anti-sigma B factor antagonist
MNIEVSREESVLIVEPREKRLDAQRALPFKEALIRYIEAGDRQIVLDLAYVEFMDSSGLGALVAILKRVGFHGALEICGARENIVDLFRLTRMDKVIRMATSRGDAVAAALSDRALM